MLKTAVLLFVFQKNPGTRDQHLHSTGSTSGLGTAGTAWTGTCSCWNNSKNKEVLLQGVPSVKVSSYGMSEGAGSWKIDWIKSQMGDGAEGTRRGEEL